MQTDYKLNNTNMNDKTDKAIRMLKALLSWSDRIGSDEIFEIQQIIKLLQVKK